MFGIVYRHEEDVRRAGNTFTPLVLETYGAMGPGAEAWFRGCIAVAEIQRASGRSGSRRARRHRRSGSGGRELSSQLIGRDAFRSPSREGMLVCLEVERYERDWE